MSKAQELWNEKWTPEQHATEYAKKRIKSAESAKLTPIKIDREDLYGYFQGSHGRYETFLDFCPCGDFRRAKVPCKHIYRLAMELGVFGGNFQSDSGKIVTPRAEKVSFPETVDLIEGLTEGAQLLLEQIAMKTRLETYYYAPIGQELDELRMSGLVIESEDGERYFEFGLMRDLLAVLDANGIPRPRIRKFAELQEFCSAQYPDLLAEHYQELRPVSVAPVYNRQDIHYYLHRKYGTVEWFDGDGYDGTPLLETDLPEDKITAELIRRGYYRRK